MEEDRKKLLRKIGKQDPTSESDRPTLKKSKSTKKIPKKKNGASGGNIQITGTGETENVTIDRVQQIADQEMRDQQQQNRHMFEPRDWAGRAKAEEKCQGDLDSCVQRAKEKLHKNLASGATTYNKTLAARLNNSYGSAQKPEYYNVVHSYQSPLKRSGKNTPLVSERKTRTDFKQKACSWMLNQGFSSYQVDSDKSVRSPAFGMGGFENQYREEHLPYRYRGIMNNHSK
jgi:hypothetical protein